MTFQQYPPQGGYPPPGAYPPPGTARRPSGATGIIAGIFAILGGLWFLAGAAFHVIELVDFTVDFLIIGAVLDFVTAASLLSGGILLLLRKGAGRVLTAIGTGVAIVCVALAFVLRATGAFFFFSYSGVLLHFGFGWLLILVLIPAIPTLVLALIPPTGRWIAAKKQSVSAVPPNFGYPPGYPPAGHPPASGPPQQAPPPGQW
ncbi:hypothetical protein AB0N89_10885 [Amycolatopsis sp. NPDC089917]|uniref:hypothetical protein n=1 Tax=Amycolatopsis sp. NPDC089917 TaxID=3155187 RepID=UPI0034345AE7